MMSIFGLIIKMVSIPPKVVTSGCSLAPELIPSIFLGLGLGHNINFLCGWFVRTPSPL